MTAAELKGRVAEASPRSKARMAGACQLLEAITATFFQVIVLNKLAVSVGPNRIYPAPVESSASRHIFRKPLDGTPKATKATAKIDAPPMGVKTCVTRRMARIKQVPAKNIPAFFLFMETPLPTPERGRISSPLFGAALRLSGLPP